MDKQELESCARKHLREGFPLYREGHVVRAHMGERPSVAYRTVSEIHHETTCFDIQFIEHICYILHINIEPKERGKGNGRKFYSAIENTARDYGSDRIRLTASGDMPDGRTKTEYMESLGYTRTRHLGGNMWEVEKILS